MKMQLVMVALVSLVAACGGSVRQEPTPASVEEALASGGTACGANVCGAGTYCCNSSCGVCAPKGGACPDVVCAVSAQPEAKQEASAASSGGPCGSNYCGKGYFCCNPGCGVCAPEGGGCPHVVCD